METEECKKEREELEKLSIEQLEKNLSVSSQSTEEGTVPEAKLDPEQIKKQERAKYAEEQRKYSLMQKQRKDHLENLRRATNDIRVEKDYYEVLNAYQKAHTEYHTKQKEISDIRIAATRDAIFAMGGTEQEVKECLKKVGLYEEATV